MTRGETQRRKFPRYYTELEVTVFHGSETFQGRINQISRGGCLIFPPLPIHEHRALKLSFRLALTLPPIHCIGEVVYTVNDKGTGTAFTEISSYSQDLISQNFESSTEIKDRRQ